jgi:hypothetical protein
MFPGLFERPLVALTDSRRPVGNTRTSGLELVALDLGYRVGELVQVGTDGTEESENRGPAKVAVSALHTREIWSIDTGVSGHLRLCEVRSDAQLAQAASESCRHGSCHIVQVALRSAPTNIVPPRWLHSRGRGTGSANSRHTGTLTQTVGGLSPEARLSRSLPRQEEPKMTRMTSNSEPPDVLRRVERAIVLTVLDHYEAHEGEACPQGALRAKLSSDEQVVDTALIDEALNTLDRQRVLSVHDHVRPERALRYVSELGLISI